MSWIMIEPPVLDRKQYALSQAEAVDGQCDEVAEELELIMREGKTLLRDAVLFPLNVHAIIRLRSPVVST